MATDVCLPGRSTCPQDSARLITQNINSAIGLHILYLLSKIGLIRFCMTFNCKLMSTRSASRVFTKIKQRSSLSLMRFL